MNSGLKKSTAEVVNPSKDEMLDQIQAAIDLVMFEARKSKIASEKSRALEMKKLLEAAIDVKTVRNKTDPLTPDEALKLLNALDLSNKSVVQLEQQNRGKGYDGKTFTERRMAAQKDLATKESIVALLKEIKDLRDGEREERREQTRGLRGVLTTGLAGFLGPAGPLVEMFVDLKKEHGEDAKKLFGRFKSFIGMQDNVHREFNLQQNRQLRNQSKMFDMLGYQFKKLAGVVGKGSGGGILDKLWDFFDGGGRSGGGAGGRGKTGKGGATTRARRAMRNMGRKAGGIGRKIGGALGKAKSLIGGGARAAGKLMRIMGPAGRMLGRFIPGIGAAIGMYGLSTTEQAKSSDTWLDKTLAYGSGALDGAAIGMMFGPLGALVGAVVGVAVTGVIRNWSSIKESVGKGFDFVGNLLGKTWGATQEFFRDAVDYTLKGWEKSKKVVGDLYDWMREKIPGFGKTVDAVKNAGAAVSNFTQSMALGGGMGSEAYTKGPEAAAAFAANNPGRNNAENMAKFTNIGKPSAEVNDAIASAAKTAGVDQADLMATINQESSFNPNAGAGTSSAKGLGQFTDDKWAEMVRKYGKMYGIGMGDRMDAKKNALMTALLMRDNKNALGKEGLDNSVTATYALHFLGDTGGRRFLKALAETPNASGAAMFPTAARANQNVFFNKDGSPRTLREIYQWMQAKVATPASEYAKSVSPKTEDQARVPSQTPGSNVNVEQAVVQGPDQTSAGAGRGNQGRTVGDVPVVLGDNNMLVVNNGMMG